MQSITSNLAASQAPFAYTSSILTPIAFFCIARDTVGRGLAYMTVLMSAPAAGTTVCRITVWASAMTATLRRDEGDAGRQAAALFLRMWWVTG